MRTKSSCFIGCVVSSTSVWFVAVFIVDFDFNWMEKSISTQFCAFGQPLWHGNVLIIMTSSSLRAEKKIEWTKTDSKNWKQSWTKVWHTHYLHSTYLHFSTLIFVVLMNLLVLLASNNRNSFHVSLLCFDLITPISIFKLSPAIGFASKSFVSERFACSPPIDSDPERIVWWNDTNWFSWGPFEIWNSWLKISITNWLNGH